MAKPYYLFVALLLLMVGCRRSTMGFLVSLSTNPPCATNACLLLRHNGQDDASAASTELHAELQSHGLALCHGILHACGVRSLSDLEALTESQLADMGVDSLDRRILLRLIHGLEQESSPDNNNIQPQLSTSVDGAFDRTIRKRFETAAEQDFCLQVVCQTNDIFRGRLFTKDQCLQISRMAEFHAYSNIGTVNAGKWTNELYTLTALHMQCKDVPGLLSAMKPIFQQLQRKLYTLFPGRIRKGSIVFESDGEPHLIKYQGKSKGTAMHIDNSEFVYITLNVMLSDEASDFCGGGTYIQAIDQTIHLQQGEMLIHLGDLQHPGVEIVSGVRRLLICFFACEWEEEALNIPKPEQARDFVPEKG